MLPAERRLGKSDISFLRTISKNSRKKNLFSPFFSLKTVYSAFKPGRFAVVVPAVVLKKAVLRNKVKRRVKAVIFKHLPEFCEEGFAAIIYAKKGVSDIDFKEIEKELTGLFKKSGIINKND